MKMHRFDKFNKSLRLWIAILCISMLVAVLASAQTNAPLLLGKEFMAHEDYKGAVKAGHTATDADPQNAEAWLLLGRALFETGAFDEAEHALTKIDDRMTKDPRILAETNNVLGNIYLVNQGELEVAQDCFQKERAYARQADDQQAEALAHYNSGQVLRKREAHTEARREFEDALNLELRDPQRILYQSALAEEFFLTGNTAAALGTMEVVDHTASKIDDAKVRAKALFAYGQLYTHAGEAERNAGNVDTSKEYFRNADTKLQAGFKVLRDAHVQDLYSEAFGYWSLGTLVETQANIAAAVERYQQSLKSAEQVGRRVELVYELKTKLGALSPLAKKESILGAIEIGSKGVKGVLVSMVQDAAGKTRTTQLYQKSVNTDLVASQAGNKGPFSDKAMTDTGKAVQAIIHEMGDVRKKPFTISRIYVACSSALAEGENRSELARHVFLATKDEEMAPAHRPNATPETSILYVNSGDELRYGIIGAIDPEDRKRASLLDIGSGNGRWGYSYGDFAGRTPVGVDIPLGSVALSKEADKSKQPGEDYITALERVADTRIGAPLRKQMDKNFALAKLEKVYIVGGAAYAMVTLMHPEAAKQDEVELTHEDFRRFYDLVKGGTVENPYRPSIDQIADNDTREVAKQQIANVHHDVFKTREQLLAAAILLRTLETNALKPDQKLIFPRHGGWALGLAQSKYFAGDD